MFNCGADLSAPKLSESSSTGSGLSPPPSFARLAVITSVSSFSLVDDESCEYDSEATSYIDSSAGILVIPLAPYVDTCMIPIPLFFTYSFVTPSAS